MDTIAVCRPVTAEDAESLLDWTWLGRSMTIPERTEASAVVLDWLERRRDAEPAAPIPFVQRR